jgi:hypothetical protein
MEGGCSQKVRLEKMFADESPGQNSCECREENEKGHIWGIFMATKSKSSQACARKDAEDDLRYI